MGGFHQAVSSLLTEEFTADAVVIAAEDAKHFPVPRTLVHQSEFWRQSKQHQSVASILATNWEASSGVVEPFYVNHKTGGLLLGGVRSTRLQRLSVDMNLRLKTSRGASSYHQANSSKSQGIHLNGTSCPHQKWKFFAFFFCLLFSRCLNWGAAFAEASPSINQCFTVFLGQRQRGVTTGRCLMKRPSP